MAEASHAVFLSYASQDAEAAQKICEALRAAGIEVFLDQSELRGGDAWDQKIRREIHDCALFIPVISANAALRHEGYFRLEWDLADQRSHMIARTHAFVVPVCLDATTEAAADVPESFKRVQWTRLRGGETPPAFVERVRRLLSPESSTTTLPSASAASGAGPLLRKPVPSFWRSKPILLAIVAVVVFAALAYFVADKFLISKHPASPPASSTGFAPPPHSIAVLPFVNLSGDDSQDYFSDGLTEELLNSLAEIEGLQVAARTSSFSFKEHPALANFFSEASLDMTQALAEYERAIALGPGNARVLSGYARQAVSLGRVDAGIAAGRRAVVLDPLNAGTHRRLGISLYFAHRYQEAIAALSDGLALDPDDRAASGSLGLAYYMLGDFEKARSSCESKQYWVAQWCLALVYSKLGRHPDAEAVLAKLKAAYGDAQAYQYATIYAQWGDTHKAVEWLETALRLRDSGLGDLKSDPLLDPLRKEPRFQAVMRELKFPQ